MALKNLDETGIFLKTAFDGYDFVSGDIGKLLLRPEIYPTIKAITYCENMYENAQEFIEFCRNNLKNYNGELYLHNKELMDKYNCGIYYLRNVYHENNPWKDKMYILFNSKQIKAIYKVCPKLNPNIAFWVCPSYKNGKINNIGFRILNQEDVQTAFKWLFMGGNNIIYGIDEVDKNKECYIVEGFRDYIALKESGYNVIGLGSVQISNIQKEFIDTLQHPIILFDNDKFGLQQALTYKNEYKYNVSILTGSEQKDAWDIFINKEQLAVTRLK